MMTTNRTTQKANQKGPAPERGSLIGPEDGKPLSKSKKPNPMAPNGPKFPVGLKRKKSKGADDHGYPRTEIHIGLYGRSK